MARQSISLTEPKDRWLKSQVESNEFSSKNELVNDLIRQARKQQSQLDLLRAKLHSSEESGFTTESKEQIVAQAKQRLNG
jgi:antitoxin ParD1/3/4